MQTECSPELFDFGRVEDRAVEAAFDAGLVTSDAGRCFWVRASEPSIWWIGLQTAFAMVAEPI